MARLQLGVRSGLWTSLAVMAALPIVAAGVSVVSSLTLERSVKEVADVRVPSLVATGELIRAAEGIVAGGPEIANATTADELKAALEDSRGDRVAADKQIAGLEKQGVAAAQLAPVKADLKAIGDNTDAIQKLTETRHKQIAQRGDQAKLFADAAIEFQRDVSPSLLRWRTTASLMARRLKSDTSAPEKSAAALDALQKASTQQDSLYDVASRMRSLELLTRTAPLTTDMDALKVNAMRAKGELEQLEGVVGKLDQRLKAVLQEHLTKMKPAVTGESSVFELQRIVRDGLNRKNELVKANVEAGAKLSKAAEHLGGTIRTAVDQSGQQAIAGVGQARMAQLVAAGIGLVVAVLVALLFVQRRVVRPLDALTAVMARLAGKDWAAEVPSRERSDEIGQMAKAVQVFKESGIENERLQHEAQEAQAREAEAKQREMERQRVEAERELKQKEEARVADEKRRQEAEETRRKQEAEAELRRKEELRKLAETFEASVRGVVDTVSGAANELKTTAGGLSATAEKTAGEVQSAAQASENASANVEGVASATEELSSSIQEIARQVARSSEIAKTAADRAASTNDTVQGLKEAADKIGQIVELITSIAGQTNLLALNATIEAARAGEQGKGFAVVAAEVKNLANQTAKATEDITKQISAIQSSTGDAVEAIGGIKSTIDEINSIAASVAAAVEEQSSATGEISRNVQETSVASQQVANNINSVAASASETGEGAQRMLAASESIARETQRLRGEVDSFIKTVRAA
jgi:methyl-accepting chemotaxis protein